MASSKVVRIAVEEDDDDDDSIVARLRKLCFKCVAYFRERQRAKGAARRARLAEKMGTHDKSARKKDLAKKLDVKGGKGAAAGIGEAPTAGPRGVLSSDEEEEPWLSYRESKRHPKPVKKTWKARIFGDPDKMTKNFAFWDPDYPIFDYQEPNLKKKVWWIGLWDKVGDYPLWLLNVVYFRIGQVFYALFCSCANLS